MGALSQEFNENKPLDLTGIVFPLSQLKIKQQRIIFWDFFWISSGSYAQFQCFGGQQYIGAGQKTLTGKAELSHGSHISVMRVITSINSYREKELQFR